MNAGIQLYEIEKIVYDILNDESNINEETGELLPEATAKLNALEIGKERLIQDVALYSVTSNGTAELINNEIKRLTVLKKQMETKANNAKKLLALYVNPGEKLNFGTVKISWRKSEAVEVDPMLSPESLLDTYPELVKAEYSVNKAEVKRYYKEHGVLPEGIGIKQNQNIQIQ